MSETTFIEALRSAADSAAAAEKRFRREVAERIAELERERAFAFRRFNLMLTVANAVARAENEETAIANGLASLRARLDWTGDSAAQAATLARFTSIIQALFASLTPTDPPEGVEAGVALAEFETWYESTHGVSFWALFEEYMAETPRVDF